MITVIVFFSALIFLITFFSRKSVDLYGSEKVGIITVEGILFDAKDAIRQIKEFEEEDKIKAIVIRVESPGGSVVASEEIYSAIKSLREKKKVVASLGGIAASGGYLVACAADKIVANPGTITGSISALMHFANVESLMQKIGLRSIVIKSGKFKDIGSPVREMTTEERALLQGLVDDIYEHLLEVISKERKIKKEELRKIADGRVFTGRQAKTLGLVDELGDQSFAVKLAASMAGLKGEPQVVYPSKRKASFKELLIDSLLSPILQQLHKQESSFSGVYYLYVSPY
ncbi:MAG: signal peptide peptidase SppA [Syntrophales bacterium]|nr:signal peptide peptidase SppA [Syntrophales bacterium]